MRSRYSPGEVLLASLLFSNQQGGKNRPVLVIQDPGDDDLLVVPVTSHAGRSAWDISVTEWRAAGLRLPSVIRVDKLATITKSAVVRPLGTLGANDRSKLVATLPGLFQVIIAGWSPP